MFVFMGNRIGSPPSGSGGDDGEEQSGINTGDSEDDDGGDGVQGVLGAAAGAAAAAAGASGAGAGATQTGGGEPSGDGDDEDEDEVTAESLPEDPAPEEEPTDSPVDPDVPTEDLDPEPVGDEDEPEPTDESESEAGEEEDDDFDEEDRLVYGDIVVDRDQVRQDDIDDAKLTRFVVVNVTDEPAYDWEFDDGDSVADRNPHYPPTDGAVVIVERDVLDDVVKSWDEREEDIPVGVLEGNGVDFEVFPSLRLVLEEPSHIREPLFDGKV